MGSAKVKAIILGAAKLKVEVDVERDKTMLQRFETLTLEGRSCLIFSDLATNRYTRETCLCGYCESSGKYGDSETF